MEKQIVLNQQNCDIDFTEYQLFGYSANNEEVNVNFNDGSHGKFKGIYCVIPTHEFDKYRNRKKNDFDLIVEFLKFEEGKYVISNQKQIVNSKQITHIFWR